jgi:hypothetical protein
MTPSGSAESISPFSTTEEGAMGPSGSRGGLGVTSPGSQPSSTYEQTKGRSSRRRPTGTQDGANEGARHETPRERETLIHPDIHCEIARQRHEELLRNAERHRIANAFRRLRRSADSKAERGITGRATVEGAWEVRGSASRG